MNFYRFFTILSLCGFLSLFVNSEAIANNTKVVVIPESAGIGGIELISNNSSIGPSALSESGLTAFCPAGKKVIGGGGVEQGNLVVADSFPDTDSSWRVNWTRDKLQDVSSFIPVTVYAVCAHVDSSADYSRISGSLQVDPTTTSEAGGTIFCPDGKRVIAGGGFENLALVMADSYPITDSSWRVNFVEDVDSTNGDETITLFAICIDAG